MFRSFKVVATFSALAALVACAGSTADEAPGTSALSSLSPEPSGAECPAGGTRIATGVDVDGNGVLDPSEVKSSQVVCNGASNSEGASAKDASLLTIDAEPQGNKCPAGGTRIQSGIDMNADGLLQPNEVKSTRYICNGTHASKGDAVSVHDGGFVNISSAESVTVIEATISAPGKGKVVAITSADVYCALPGIGQGYDCSTSTTTRGYFTLSTSPTADASSDSYDYFHLSPNSTENVTRSAVFEVMNPGDVTVYLRASAITGTYAFFRPSLTLFFVPE